MADFFSHRIEVFTASLVIGGSYDMAIYRRVSDALNGEQRRYLSLRDAVVTPLHKPQAAQQVPLMLVARSEMLVVATVEEAPPPVGYDRVDFMHSRAPMPAMFFTSALAVRGVAHVRPDLSVDEQLERIDDEFVSLSRVQIFPLGGGQPFERAFAALRRESIVALYPLSERLSVTPMPPLPADPPRQRDDQAVVMEDAEDDGDA